MTNPVQPLARRPLVILGRLAQYGMPLLIGLAMVSLMPTGLGKELLPIPDAREYAWMSYNLIERGIWQLPFGDTLLPPRYPWGYPLLLAGWAGTFGLVPENYYLFSSFCMLVLTFLMTLTCYYVQPRAPEPYRSISAALVGCFGASCPLALRYGVQVMSDLPSTLICGLLVCLSIYLVQSRATKVLTPLLFALAGLLGGYSLSLRITNALFAGPVILLLMTRRASAKWSRLALLLGACLPIAWLLWLQQFLYGHPLKTGYSFWLPEHFSHCGSVFAISNILESPDEFRWQEGTNLATYLDMLLGFSSPKNMLASFVMTSFVLIGVVRGIRVATVSRTVVTWLLAALAGLFVVYAAYKWRNPRFLLPLLPIVMPLAALGLEPTLRSAAQRALSGAPARMYLLVTVLAIGGVHHAIGVSQSARSSGDPPPLHEHLQQAAEAVAPDAWVLSDISIPMLDFYVLSPRRAQFMPLIVRESLGGLREQPLTLLASGQRHELPTSVQAARERVEADSQKAIRSLVEQADQGPLYLIHVVVPSGPGRTAYDKTLDAVLSELRRAGLRETVAEELPTLRVLRLRKQT